MTMRSSKMVKVPNELVKFPNKKGSLKLDGMSVIEICFYTQGIKGTFFAGSSSANCQVGCLYSSLR